MIISNSYSKLAKSIGIVNLGVTRVEPQPTWDQRCSCVVAVENQPPLNKDKGLWETLTLRWKLLVVVVVNFLPNIYIYIYICMYIYITYIYIYYARGLVGFDSSDRYRNQCPRFVDLGDLPQLALDTRRTAIFLQVGIRYCQFFDQKGQQVAR